jgi:DNA replication and repair protein RecF
LWIQDLLIKDFRNIERAELKLGPGWNVFFGKNAQGKTNVLEAVYYLSTSRSFRTKNLQEIPRFGAESFLIRAAVHTDAAPLTVASGYGGGRKKVTLNGEALATMEKMIGVFPVVLVTNANIDLAGKPPESLRRFLDAQLSQSMPEYLKALLQYEKVLRYRNMLLRDAGAAARRQLAVWTQKLVQLGSRIFDARMKAVRRLAIFARLNLKRLSAEKEEMEVRYLTQASGEGEAEIEKNYGSRLAETSEKERERGFTLVGPHRDSLMFLIEGRPAHKFASTGQRKSLGLALKLAEAEIIRSYSRSEPAVLLDEIFNEIDEERRGVFASLLGRRRQVLCTTAEKATVDELRRGGAAPAAFRVSGGRIAGHEG